jgi:hypothetical protein
MIKRTLLASAIAVLVACNLAFAEQRALLVGVGKYSAPGNDLPGIDLDVNRMRDTLNVMGFDDSQIHTLLDQEATAANVISEVSGWLTEGVQPNDRVVFYFSGHGSHVPDFDGDEPDGVDEVLVTHDVRRARVEGRSTLVGVVKDDEFNALLSAIPSQNILTIVDACHSGTSTRSFNLDDKSLASDPVFAKSFMYEGMPVRTKVARSRGVDIIAADESSDVNFVSISAADDDEKAIGTSKGGIFTIGLSNAIIEAAKTGNSITLTALRDQASAYIQSKLVGDRIHHPQVTGNSRLANGALQIVPLADGNGPNQKRLLELVGEQSSELALKATKTIYVIDDPVELSMRIPAGGGYLNVVTVDAQDNATVLFPNQFQLDNAVSAGAFSIPTETMAFELPASEPLGPTLVAAFVTQDPINFHEQAIEGRDADGKVNVAFTTLSATATRAIRIAPKRKQMYAAAVELSVVAKP